MPLVANSRGVCARRLRRYVNLAYKTVQGTGGFNAMANSWDQLRQAGAEARAPYRCRGQNGSHSELDHDRAGRTKKRSRLLGDVR